MAKGNNPEAIIKIAKSKDLKDFLDRSKIDSHYFEELVSGILSDTDFKPFNEFNDVCTYCYKVAGTVGIMICNIFGVTDKKTYDYAAKLGIALQLTNILRDIQEDARRGRIYLSTTDMGSFGVTREQIFSGSFSNELHDLMLDYANKTVCFYKEGIKGADLLPKKTRYSILLSAHLYFQILVKLKKRDMNPFLGRVYTKTQEKILIALLLLIYRRKSFKL